MSYLIFTIKLSVLLGLISCNEGHVFLITWCLGPNELVKKSSFMLCHVIADRQGRK